MPITSSAKKAWRASRRKRMFNLARKEALKEAVKKFRGLVKDNKITEAKAFVPELYKAIDKAAKRGVIKSGGADRHKSRLTSLLVPK